MSSAASFAAVALPPFSNFGAYAGVTAHRNTNLKKSRPKAAYRIEIIVHQLTSKKSLLFVLGHATKVFFLFARGTE